MRRRNTWKQALLTVLLAGLMATVIATDVQAQNSRLFNISTRGLVGTGDEVLIGGFIIDGTAPLQVLIRARGPSLEDFGVQGVLANPEIELRQVTGELIQSNDDWRQGGQELEIIASGLAPTRDLESVIIITLAPGAYTPIIRGVGATTGVAAVDIFEYQPTGGGTYNLTGTIFAPSNAAIDSDVNDPGAPFVANDTGPTAQTIPAPVVLGGYVNLPNAGADGRSFAAGDTEDFFKTSLPANATVTLLIASDDPVADDLDLYLFDTAGTLLDSSESTTGTESVTAPQTAEYVIAVSAFSGASNYIMLIGQSGTAAPSQGLSLRHDFIPGQIVVRFKDDVLPRSGVDSLVARADSVGLRGRAGAPGRVMLMELPDGQGRGQARTILGLDAALSRNRFWLDKAPAETVAKFETLMAVKALRNRADVETADPNYMRYALATPNDSAYGFQWHYPLINLPQAWDVTPGSNTIVAAVIDTGALPNHPDLQARLMTGPGSGYDFIDLEAISGDGTGGIDPDWTDVGDGGGAQPSSFHGTHVAGTMGATTNNGTGVAGVDWNSRLMTLRVLGIGGGTSYDIIQGVLYASNQANDSGGLPQQQAAVMNLSLGGGGYSQGEQNVYTAARNAGTVIIAAAGNENTSQLSYPASYNGVVSVSAVDMQKNRAPYSNFGSAIDVAAPGGDTSQDLNGDGYQDGVLSTLADDSGGGLNYNYAFYQGTSMAAPHMAGVVSLMKAVNPAMTPADLDGLLAGGSITEDLGSAGWDTTYGWGLIDALGAVVAAGGTGPNNPTLAVTPSGLNFGLAATSATLSASNAGGGTLTVNAPTDDAPWLSVAPASVNGNGVGSYTATVNRTGLPDGAYAATITFTSNANTVAIPVVMQVGTGTSGDAGFHYVLLIDPTDFSTVGQAAVGANNGQYVYGFQGVAPGNYLLVAGTDSDNDLFICDSGEACGGFPVLSQMTEVVVTSFDVSGLDFDTGFDVTVTAGAAGESTQIVVPRQGFALLPRE